MENQQKRYDRKPNFNTHAKLSRDGRYWIITRTETWVLPRKYLDVIAENHAREALKKVDQQPMLPGMDTAEPQQPQKKGKRNANSDGQGN